MPWLPIKSKTSQIRDILDANNRNEARQYRAAFGLVASQAVNRMVAEHHLAAGINAGWSKSNCLTTADTLVGLELNHGLTARGQIAALAYRVTNNTLHNGLAGANVLPLANYGAVVGDTNRMKAAKWIVNASNSLNHAAHDAAVDATLALIIQNNVGRTMQGLTAINTAFNFAAGPAPQRYIDTGGGRLPAPPTGLALLQQNVVPVMDNFVPANANQWKSLALYYLGAVIRAHGFPDQNGRTGRALYALCLLWGGVPFEAPTNAFEQTIHQL
jgi:hypothetical protein